ncbi:MAG: hypothetical protein BWY59_02029 [Verrucomicrobia bacterium ADurb.Bin345]|nr:MAG: hypothetical protein BWY59_02029 [Verrucomicrobia bacterium ADurb.Bin345]
MCASLRMTVSLEEAMSTVSNWWRPLPLRWKTTRSPAGEKSGASELFTALVARGCSGFAALRMSKRQMLIGPRPKSLLFA